MMETSAPDTAAIRYGNLTASCFANQLAKKEKKKNIIPYVDLCTTHPHLFQIPWEKQPSPTETLMPFNADEGYY